MRKDFWAGKRVFITGHTGFKGGWLSLWLTDMGATVKGYALAPPTTPAFFDLAGVGSVVETDINDVRDSVALTRSLKQFNPDVVLHLAAQPQVRYSFLNPVLTLETNVMGTLNLLEAVRSVESVRAMINVTSDKCYENQEWHWGYRENEPVGGHDPYSASKACSEIVTSSFRRSYFGVSQYQKHRCAIATARAGNVIGGGDWSMDRLVPDILRDLSSNKPVVIRNPHAIRPWQHVLEPLSGYLMLAEHLFEHGMKYAEAWNFGPVEDSAKPVQAIVEELIQLWGENAQWQLDEGDHPHEASYLKLDCSKARNLLGWSNTWDLSATLAAVARWHKAYMNNENLREVSLSDIHQYIHDMSPPVIKDIPTDL